LKIFISGFNLIKQKENFIKFASDNNVKFNKEEFEKDQEYIFQRLKAYIARELWGNDGWYEVMLKVDKQFQTAVQLFETELIDNKVKLENDRK